MTFFWCIVLLGSVLGVMAFPEGSHRWKACAVLFAGVALDVHIRRGVAFGKGIGIDFGDYGYLVGVAIMAATAAMLWGFDWIKRRIRGNKARG
jgi:hypothetical protein